MVCNDFRYHSILDFTSNTALMRVLVSHELGHNFSANHDAPGSNFIMTPNVNNRTNWSTQSVNEINAFANPLQCLSLCGQNAPPVASFYADPTEGCAPHTTNFYDQSSNDSTSRLWSFPGGTPSTSTQQHPTVIYNQPGMYHVTLMATNAGESNTLTLEQYIHANTIIVAGFYNLTLNRTVSFFNETIDGTSWEWNF